MLTGELRDFEILKVLSQASQVFSTDSALASNGSPYSTQRQRNITSFGTGLEGSINGAAGLFNGCHDSNIN